MAVPKNKRYKQVVKTRRSLQKLNLITKKNLTLNKFTNFVNLSSNYINTVQCFYCRNKQITNQLCANCYVTTFAQSFFEKKDNNRIRIKQNHIIIKHKYAKLSTSFIPFSRSESLTLRYRIV